MLASRARNVLRTLSAVEVSASFRLCAFAASWLLELAWAFAAAIALRVALALARPATDRAMPAAVFGPVASPPWLRQRPLPLNGKSRLAGRRIHGLPVERQ